MAGHTPGPWYYIGDNVVGVSANCDCPSELEPVDPGEYMHGAPPHEGHEIVPAVMVDDLPEGVTMERHIANCKLIAAAPALLAACVAAGEADAHFRTCRQCGADLHGNVWYCGEGVRLRARADDLRCAAVAAAEGRGPAGAE